MTVDDYYKLAWDFGSNLTMLKLLTKYAKAAASEADSNAEKDSLLRLAEMCRDGQGHTMRAWEDLSKLADHCAGQAYGWPSAPAQVIAMARHWEDLSEEAAENF